MADPLDVLTLAEAKDAVNLKLNDEHDTELGRMVTAASRRLDKLVGPVVQRGVTDELEGDCDTVYLTRFPVASVTSVAEYDGTDTPATVDSADYRTRPYSGDPTLRGNALVRRDDVEWAETVTVEYVAGRYADTASVDGRFKFAAGLMLQNAWQSQENSIAEVEEYDVPQQRFPRKAVTSAVRDLFPGEIQDPLLA